MTRPIRGYVVFLVAAMGAAACSPEAGATGLATGVCLEDPVAVEKKPVPVPKAPVPAPECAQEHSDRKLAER